jgi:opacity protein-like surface antigen
MKKLNRLAVLLATAVSVSSIAYAMPLYYPNGVYLQLNGNASFMNIKMSSGGANDSNAIVPAVANTTQNNTVGSFGGEIGYSDDEYPLAVDISYNNYRKFDFNRSPVFSPTTYNYNLRSDASAQTILGNFEIDIRQIKNIEPYVQAGAGIAYFNNSGKATSTGSDGITYGISRTYWRFAWQIGLGVKFTVTPHIMLGIHYNYVPIGLMHIAWTATEGGGTMRHKINGDLASNDIGLDIAYYFDPGTPPTPTLIDNEK